MKIDLHSHSTASDGVLAPGDLVRRAHEHGVQMLALTDHDTLAGIPEAQQTATELGIQLVTGIELSCTWGGATIHVLGYDFALDNKELCELVDEMHEARWLRAKEIDRRLHKAGFAGCLEGAQQIQTNHSMPPARPHFAAFMLQQGYVKDHSEAFKKWLGAGKIGDVKQHWPQLERIMQVLSAAKAKISLAHPYQYDFTNSKRRRLVADFVAFGGHALEVSNGMQPAEQVGVLSNMARSFALKISAGSDFHAPHPFSEIGSYRVPTTDLACLWHDFNLPENRSSATGV